MLTPFALDYALWVFVSAVGVVQVVAVLSQLRGLLLLRPWPRLNLALGAALVVFAFAWYFSSDARNRPDTTVGLDGNQQAALFAISGALAVAFTFLVSSLLNHRWAAGTGPHKPGLDALRRTTFVRAVVSEARRWKGSA